LIVTGIETLWVSVPLVPVTVTVPFRGVGPEPPPLLPPPPQETVPNRMAISKRPRKLLHHAPFALGLRLGFMVSTIPRANAKVA
jgi:hypothetical protein